MIAELRWLLTVYRCWRRGGHRYAYERTGQASIYYRCTRCDWQRREWRPDFWHGNRDR